MINIQSETDFPSKSEEISAQNFADYACVFCTYYKRNKTAIENCKNNVP